MASTPVESEDRGSSQYECNICLETAVEPVVTFCGHLFCWADLFRWMRTGHTTCPVCKSGISRETVIPLYGRGGDRKSAGAARPDGASGVASSGTPHDVATPEAGGAAGDAHAATGSAAGFADSADAGAVPPEGSGEETAAAAAGRPMPTEDASVGAGAAAAAGDDEIPRRPHGQRTVAPGGAHRNVPAADPHGFFGPGQRPGNPFDPYGPQGNNNFAFTAGFGFFPSLFGLQFQTFGIGSGAQSGNDAGRAGGGPGRDQPLSPEEQHQLLLSRVLLAVGCLVVLMLLFL